MTLMQILEEEEREEQEWDQLEGKRKRNIFVRFLISMIQNILYTLERK